MTHKQRTLAKGLLRAGAALGLSPNELGLVIGHDVTTIERFGLDPSSLAGLRALLLIRIYVRLVEVIGHSPESVGHWMRTANSGLGAVPAELIQSSSGLERVAEYLDAFS